MPRDAGIGGSAGQSQTTKSQLRDWVNEWKRLDDRIKDIREWLNTPVGERGEQPPGLNQVDSWSDERTELRVRIMDTLETNPRFADNVMRWGFSYEGFDHRDYTDQASDTGNSPDTYDNKGSDGGGGGKGGGGRGDGGGSSGEGGAGGGGGGRSNGANARGQARDNRLLDGYKVVRGPKGTYAAVYTYKIDGEKYRVGIKLGKDADKLARYGIKPSEAKQLTAGQMKRIKNIGTADELAPHIKRGDKHVLKSLTRYFNNQYEGQPILEDDEVMSVVIANSMFGWSPGEFENQLRNTKWWKNTEEYQRNYQTTMSPKARKNAIDRTLEMVTNELEDNYGLQWLKHVDGGIKQARKWAETIASGVWGEPGAGFEFWRNKMFDKAAAVEGTPAWVTQQAELEQVREFNNRPEDMFERLRSEAMNYLGQQNGKPLIDRETLMRWSTDIVTEQRSDGDWQQFLRQQMRNLHPYFDENIAFTEQASPYKSMAEGILGTPLSWDDKLLRDFTRTDPKGNPTDRAMSLHDYEMLLRDPDRNPRAWQEGTALWDEGMNFVSQLENTFLGVR